MESARQPVAMLSDVPPLAGGRPAVMDADRAGEVAAVQAVLDGETNAFEFLVSRHERLVYTMLLRLVGNVEEAEDLAQETFVRAFESLRTYDQARPFQIWLLRIARNLAISAMRRRGRLISLDDWEESAGPVPDMHAESALETADHNHRIGLLRKAIEALPGPVRALVLLRYREEMKIDDISKAMDMSPSNVKVALHRARHRLRAALFGNTAPPERRIP